MTRPRPPSREAPRRLAIGGAAALLVTLGALGVAGALRSCAAGGRRAARPDVTEAPPGAPSAATTGAPGADREAPPPSTGWEDAAETLVGDARRLLQGQARAGAFAEAAAEAAREDLALYPPPRDRLYRALMGGEQERTWALAALAARPEPDDDLVHLVLRSQRPEDGEVVRLLGAELVAGLPPELLSRHEEELLRAFEGEENPLVLALALPALERMDDVRLRALMTAQLQLASPSMVPVLLGLARDRLGPEAVAAIAR